MLQARAKAMGTRATMAAGVPFMRRFATAVAHAERMFFSYGH